MALEVFPYTVASWNAQPIKPISRVRYPHSFRTKKIVLADRHFRTIQIRLPRKTQSELEAILDWIEARGIGEESFLIADADRAQRTGVGLGTASAAQTDFPLDEDGPEGGDYPKNDVDNTTIYFNASPQTIDTIDTDNREISTVGGAAGGETVTADYVPLLRVEIEDFTVENPGGLHWRVSLSLLETKE